MQPSGRSILLRKDGHGYLWCCSECGWSVRFSDSHGRPNSAVEAVGSFHHHSCADHPTNLSRVLQPFVKAAVEVVGAAKGNLQLLNAKTRMLEIVAQYGFTQAFLRGFQEVPGGFGVCGVALRKKQRLLVRDVFSDEAFHYLRPAFAAADIKGCLSSPLVSRSGQIIGMLSTHFAVPSEPPPEVLRRLDAEIEEAVRCVESLSASVASDPLP